MDDAENPPSPSSPASSGSEYHAVDDASAYARLEEDRRQHCVGKGNLMTGCRELDEYVLLGGFERGSIVGVSAEGEEMGLIIGLQTLARLLAKDRSAKATVVTTMPTTALLPKLRAALVGQICPLPGRPDVLRDRVRLCLERISIARVFDLEGVAEVIEELEHSSYIPYPRSRRDSRGAKAEEQPDHAASLKEEAVQQQQQGKHWTEVEDSEDEESVSCGQSTSEKPPAEHEAPVSGESGSRPLPDMVLVTHMSTLMSTLFTSRSKEFAHSFMGLLSDHLHCLTRYSEHDAPPLFMLLNSTSSSPSSAHHHSDEHRTAMPIDDRDHRPQKQPDSTLRSIFNPPPQPSMASIPGHHQPEGNLNNFASAHRNKPSFGLVFSQMLDLHLLCTRIPRTRADAAALRAAAGSPRGRAVVEDDRVSYVWAVEVLLDEIGVYERSCVDGSCDWTRRTNREQRWAAVDVDREGKVVNAFTS
ncbi:uncharacterized protein B0T15DRAFT_571324 [Chaetomium strumarium]|uniref:Uncharacterized protein n=1 Tax=Chaetomium strumarium TaxID=1170767 RepID=A0AAJ0H2Z0_9PEZI|nr:hypothetical protein B0T15DRAFT_571324 [Chaetomium strumarium]